MFNSSGCGVGGVQFQSQLRRLNAGVEQNGSLPRDVFRSGDGRNAFRSVVHDEKVAQLLRDVRYRCGGGRARVWDVLAFRTGGSLGAQSLRASRSDGVCLGPFRDDVRDA